MKKVGFETARRLEERRIRKNENSELIKAKRLYCYHCFKYRNIPIWAIKEGEPICPYCRRPILIDRQPIKRYKTCRKRDYQPDFMLRIMAREVEEKMRCKNCDYALPLNKKDYMGWAPAKKGTRLYKAQVEAYKVHGYVCTYDFSVHMPNEKQKCKLLKQANLKSPKQL